MISTHVPQVYQALYSPAYLFDLQEDDVISWEGEDHRVVSTSSYPWCFPGFVYGNMFEIALLPLTFRQKPYEWLDGSKEDWDLFWKHQDEQRARIKAHLVWIKNVDTLQVMRSL